MTIRKVSSSKYSTVKAKYVANDIIQYSKDILQLVTSCCGAPLESRNKSQLNQIAAELETVKKRLEWIIEGKY